MLDADAHGEGLAFHRDAHGVQPCKGVPRGMPDGEHDVGAGDALRALRRLDGHGAKCVFARFDAGQLCAKAHSAAEGNDLLAQRLDHAPQHVRPDVGLCVIGDGRRRTEGVEDL